MLIDIPRQWKQKSTNRSILCLLCFNPPFIQILGSYLHNENNTFLQEFIFFFFIVLLLLLLFFILLLLLLFFIFVYFLLLFGHIFELHCM